MGQVKYIQREETRYANNEFSNMPSIDFRGPNSPDLTADNIDRIDLDVVKKICDKYGFRFTTIYNTFSGNGVEFIIYFKTPIPAEQYNELYKSSLNSREDNKRFWELQRKYNDIYIKMHQCVHELDEQTDLLFNCGWQGNCGLFGSHDVRRESYSFGGHLTSWNSIIDRWSPCIHDTLSKLSKGIYALMSSNQIKPQFENSPKLEEYEPIILKTIRECLDNNHTADFEMGKRQCDTNEEKYRAIIIRNSRKQYCGLIRLYRDWVGRYHVTYAAPLCGESHFVLNWKAPHDDVESIVHYLTR